MFKKWAPFLLVLMSFLVIWVLTGGYLRSLYQPFEFLLTLSVYAAFFLASFGFTRPSQIPASILRRTAKDAFLPAIVLTMGKNISHASMLVSYDPSLLHEMVAVTALCTSYSVLLLIGMMCLGKRSNR